MKPFKLNKSKIFVIFFSGLLLITLTILKYKRQPFKYVPVTGETISKGQKHLGYSACVECHRDIVETHLETAHFKTSALSNLSNIKGNFNEGFNIFELNDHVFFKMISNENGQFQVAYDKSTNIPIYNLKFEINIGSGTKGQSYLTWIHNGLYQQQISYYSPTNSWINSPMYPKERFVEPRPIIPQCIGCHTTYAKPMTENPFDNQYNKNSFVLGIDCERCHGPAEEHVKQAKLGDKQAAKSIVKFNNLTRQQRLDACALCHSGLIDRTKYGNLNYQIGEELAYAQHEFVEESQDIDVHGNQYGLLIRSKCFKESTTMDCSTCHNVHKNERGQAGKFNQQCLECHSTDKTKHNSIYGNYSKLNCIDCHMPVESSKTLLINNSLLDSVEPLKVRSHYIKIN